MRPMQPSFLWRKTKPFVFCVYICHYMMSELLVNFKYRPLCYNSMTDRFTVAPGVE